MTVLRVLVRTAVEDRLMERDVTAGIKLAPRQDREMSIATPAQAREIQSAIAAPYRLLVETMFATAVRYGEAMGLRPEDIEVGPDSATIRIRRTLVEVKAKPIVRHRGKTPGLRRVPDLPSFMQYAVAGRYCAGCRHGHAHVIM